MPENFLGKTILVITAHPDDESFLCGGTIYGNFQAGGKTFLVCATLGEKGSLHLRRPITKKSLKQRRKSELLLAAKFLHISKLYSFNFPDGGLLKKEKEYYDKCLKIAARIKPESVLGFGPDGITGHYDHVTSGKVALKIAKKLKIPFYAFSLQPKLIKSAEVILNSREKKNYYLDKVSFKKPNVRVLIDPKIKMRAIHFHKSQLEKKKNPATFSKFLTSNTKKSEYFKK